MAAGVRITLASFPPAGGTPETYDTETYASPSAAVSGITSGFLPLTTNAGEVLELNVAQIKSIVAATF